jgi:hypothetical protein
MEMARVTRRLRLLFAFAIAGLTAGGCGKSVCPSGMRQDGKRSQAGVNAYCVSTTDQSRTSFIQLYRTGGPRQICAFSGGRASGPYQGFHPNGARWLEGRYENGLKVGRWTQWAPDGRKVADGEYHEGQAVQGAPVGFPATCEKITW